MRRESLEEFLTRGGNIEKVYYKTFDEVEMTKGDLKAIGYAWKKHVHLAKEAGIKSGEARRAKAAQGIP